MRRPPPANPGERPQRALTLPAPCSWTPELRENPLLSFVPLSRRISFCQPQHPGAGALGSMGVPGGVSQHRCPGVQQLLLCLCPAPFAPWGGRPPSLPPAPGGCPHRPCQAFGSWPGWSSEFRVCGASAHFSPLTEPHRRAMGWESCLRQCPVP